MRDLIKLIGKIDKVIAQFLLQKKIGLTQAILDQTSVDTILTNLRSNIAYYKSSSSQSEASQSMFWKATGSMVASVQYLYQTTESALRSLTNTDSSYRLDTIAWLYWTRQHFSVMVERYANLSSVIDLRIFAENLKIEIKAFFATIERILNETPPDEKSAFHLDRDDKKFLIYGLKGSSSELVKWFRKYLSEKFKTPVLMESILEQCREKCEVIVVRAERQALIAEHRAPLMATIKQLQENNAVLERELAYTNRLASQYQSELVDSEARSSTLQEDLALKASQERAYEESIKKLMVEKETIELRQQTQRTEDPAQNKLLRSEIEMMRRRLDAAIRDKAATLEEKTRLESAVQAEHQQQEELRLQLERVHQEKAELARELLPVPADIQQLDEQAMTDILEPYSQAEDPLAEVEIQDADGEYEEELDLDKLMSSLKIHAQKSESSTEKKRAFPLYADAVESGCTSAQNHVFRGKYNYLQHLLMQEPETVNTICRDLKTNPLGSKTLLELAMFHVNFLVFRPRRKAMVELILKFRPIIFDSQICVFETIRNRINNKDSCDLVLRELFCQYVIAQKTCSAKARADFSALLKKAELAYQQLQQTPDIILVDGKRCDVLLREFDDALKTCRDLYASYMEGDVQPIQHILKRETPMEFPEFYEVLLDPPEKSKADAAYKLKYSRSTYVVSLLECIEARHMQCVAARPPKRIINNISYDSDIQREAKNVVMMSYADMKIEKESRGPIDIYEELGTSLSAMLMRFGIVLSAKGFNAYQLDEIRLQRSLELDAAAELNRSAFVLQ